MKINLKRPIVFFDLETTGLNRETDRIVEMAFIKVSPDGRKSTFSSVVNPEMPIPAESTYIHGIDDERAQKSPTFHQLAEKLLEFISDSDIGGFGSNAFDLPVLYQEFKRANIEWDYIKANFIDVGNIFKIQHPRNLFEAYKTYCNKEHLDEHTAVSDVQATVEVFFAQCEHPEMPSTVEEIAKYSNYGKGILDLSGKFVYNDSGEIVFNFGKHRGQPAKNHLDFVYWMYNKDFQEDTKRVCESLLHPQDVQDEQHQHADDSLPF